MTNNRFPPPGWDEERVRRVLAHYETQTEEEAVAEDERAFKGKGQAVETPIVPIVIPDLNDVREFAAKLHAEGKPWKGEAFGWPAEYNPERPEPPLDSKMTFTPADFCIGESGIWFFSLMWEHGKDKEPTEFLDDRNIIDGAAG